MDITISWDKIVYETEDGLNFLHAFPDMAMFDYKTKQGYQWGDMISDNSPEKFAKRVGYPKIVKTTKAQLAAMGKTQRWGNPINWEFQDIYEKAKQKAAAEKAAKDAEEKAAAEKAAKDAEEKAAAEKAAKAAEQKAMAEKAAKDAKKTVAEKVVKEVAKKADTAKLYNRPKDIHTKHQDTYYRNYIYYPPMFSYAQMVIEAERMVEQVIQQRIAVQIAQYEHQFTEQTSYYETRIAELENYVKYLSKLLMESSQMCWSLYHKSNSAYIQPKVIDWTERFQYPVKPIQTNWINRIKVWPGLHK